MRATAVEHNGNGRNGVQPGKTAPRKPKSVDNHAAFDAPFAALAPPAKDAPIWPVHRANWLQPELRLQLSASSGLRIERRQRIPIPDFAYFEMIAVCRPPSPDRSCHVSAPRRVQQFPHSDLVPLGWDPRTILNSRKELEP